MKSLPVLTDLNPATLDALPCCGLKNPEHPGRIHKNCWLQTQFKKGLHAKVLLTPDNRQCGYIEYLPGEYAWRGVNARGYMFIHCVWTFFKQYQHQGHGARLVQAAVEDARSAGLQGVAVIARDRPWLASPALFLRNGFRVVDSAPPDYQLLVMKLDPDAADPSFKKGWEAKLKEYDRGFTIIRSQQCSHVTKFADEIAESAAQEYGLKPRIVELKTYRDAQNAPTPYADFALIYNGRLIADHPISRTRFRNIMNKLR